MNTDIKLYKQSISSEEVRFHRCLNALPQPFSGLLFSISSSSLS